MQRDCERRSAGGHTHRVFVLQLPRRTCVALCLAAEKELARTSTTLLESTCADGRDVGHSYGCYFFSFFFTRGWHCRGQNGARVRMRACMRRTSVSAVRTPNAVKPSMVLMLLFVHVTRECRRPTIELSSFSDSLERHHPLPSTQSSRLQAPLSPGRTHAWRAVSFSCSRVLYKPPSVCIGRSTSC